MVVVMIPVVGQVADVRDLSAYLYQLTQPTLSAEARRLAWVGLVLTGVALALPEVGAAVAGVGRLALKGGLEEARLAVRLLRRVGRGNVLAYAERQLAAGPLAEVAQRGFDVVAGHLRQFFTAVERTWLPVGEAVRGAARRALDDLARVTAEARTEVRRVAGEIAAKAQKLLHMAEQEGERAGGRTNAEAAHEAPAEATGRGPEPEGPGGDKESRLAAAKRQRIERIRQQRLREGIADAERRGALDRLTDEERDWLNADYRRKELAFDPDTKRFKIAEAQTALRAEDTGLLPSPIRRSGFADLGEGGADYIDGAGVQWDVKDASADLGAVVEHARDGENILVDAGSVSRSQAASIAAAAEQQLGPSATGRIVVIPSP